MCFTTVTVTFADINAQLTNFSKKTIYPHMHKNCQAASIIEKEKIKT